MKDSWKKGYKEILTIFLKENCLGEKRALSSQMISDQLMISRRYLRDIVNELRAEGTFVCSCDKGYYLAETDEEISKTIRQLESRISAISKAKDGLQKTYLNKGVKS